MNRFLQFVVVLLIFLCGYWLHPLLNPKGQNFNSNQDEKTASRERVILGPSMAANPKKQHNSKATDNADDGMVKIPIKNLNGILKLPIGSDLIPRSSLISVLGIDSTKIGEITDAFKNFKSSLEILEQSNTKLIKAKDGDYFEIAPYPYPSMAFDELGNALRRTLGPDDWRVEFLIGGLQSSGFTGGLGKYRQEIAIQSNNDSGGGTYDMIYTKLFDNDGKILNKVGFQVVPNQPIGRYSAIFATANSE